MSTETDETREAERVAGWRIVNGVLLYCGGESLTEFADRVGDMIERDQRERGSPRMGEVRSSGKPGEPAGVDPVHCAAVAPRPALSSTPLERPQGEEPR